MILRSGVKRTQTDERERQNAGTGFEVELFRGLKDLHESSSTCLVFSSHSLEASFPSHYSGAPPSHYNTKNAELQFSNSRVACLGRVVDHAAIHTSIGHSRVIQDDVCAPRDPCVFATD